MLYGGTRPVLVPLITRGIFEPRERKDADPDPDIDLDCPPEVGVDLASASKFPPPSTPYRTSVPRAMWMERSELEEAGMDRAKSVNKGRGWVGRCVTCEEYR